MFFNDLSYIYDIRLCNFIKLRKMSINSYKIEEVELARFAKALSHPARIQILKLLINQNACYCGNIVDELPLSQSTVSQHLKELKEVGFIQGTFEQPKIKYCINQENWSKAKILLSKFFEFHFNTDEGEPSCNESPKQVYSIEYLGN